MSNDGISGLGTDESASAGLGSHESAAATKEDMVLPLAAQGNSRRLSQEIVLPKEPLFLPVLDQIKDDAAAALVHQVFAFTHTHTHLQMRMRTCISPPILCFVSYRSPPACHHFSFT